MSGRYHVNHTTRLARLADQAHEETNVIYYDRLKNERADNVIFFDIFNQRFGELVAEECAQICMSQADRRNIRHAFGLPVESNIKYKAPENHWSVESQYDREYNLPNRPHDAQDKKEKNSNRS